MTSHKIVWYIALSTALAAALVLWVRSAGERDEHIPDRADVAPEALVATMLDRLERDHPMEDPQTETAVRRVAELAEGGILSTAEAYYALGLDKTEKSAFEAAEQAFQKAIQLKPGWSWPYNALGILLGNHSKDREAEAEAAFRKAIEIEPGWSRPHNDLAILLRLSQRMDEAEKEALIALELDPESVATHNNYGNLLVAQMRLDEAEREYLKAISINPNHPKPYYNLACVYALQAKTDDALSLLEKSIALNPALRENARQDPDFDRLQDNPRFQAILKT